MVTTPEPSRRRRNDSASGDERAENHALVEEASASGLVDPATAARMSRQRRRDTAPEIALRRELHRRGLRFRVDHPLPAMPRRRGDLVFTRARLVVFVDGCFWHACPEHGTQPTTRAEWWLEKLARNVNRDRDTDSRLAAEGWTVLRIWEHEDPTVAAGIVDARYRSLLRRR